MDFLQYVHDALRYRSVFSRADPYREYLVACDESEISAAVAWFRRSVGQGPRLLVLDNPSAGGKETMSITEFKKRPDLALVVYGARGRRKAVQLAGHGIREFAFHTDQRYTNHKFDPEIVYKYASRIRRIFKSLEDEESRLVYASVIKHRLTGDHGYLRISRYQQYLHPQVKARPGDWIGDCGALTGKTALSFAKVVGPKGKVFAFEPDPESFKRLSHNTKNQRRNSGPITALNYGVSNKPGVLSFASGRAGASKFVEDGNIKVPVDTLDKFSVKQKLSGLGMLSFDVEGFESEALDGATKMIRRLRPKLQISLYHKKVDIIRLPLWVMENFEGSKLYMGHHSSHHAETDLYVLP